MTDYALKFAEAAQKLTGVDDVHKPWEQAHRMYQTLGPVLAAHDVFICPTNNAPVGEGRSRSVGPDTSPWTGKKVDPEYRLGDDPPVQHAAQLPGAVGAVGPCARRAFRPASRSWAAPGTMRRVFRAALAYEKAVGGWYAAQGNDRPRL